MSKQNPFVPHDVPDNFDQEVWDADAHDYKRAFEEVREEILKSRSFQPVIAPRQNIIDYVEPYTVNGKRNKAFSGEEHRLYILSEHPPSDGHLIYENKETGVYISREIYLPDTSLDGIKPYAKSLFHEAKKLNRKARKG